MKHRCANRTYNVLNYYVVRKSFAIRCFRIRTRCKSMWNVNYVKCAELNYKQAHKRNERIVNSSSGEWWKRKKKGGLSWISFKRMTSMRWGYSTWQDFLSFVHIPSHERYKWHVEFRPFHSILLSYEYVSQFASKNVAFHVGFSNEMIVDVFVGFFFLLRICHCPHNKLLCVCVCACNCDKSDVFLKLLLHVRFSM